MRYYLDTNILIYITSDQSELSRDISIIISDPSNILLTSPVCVMEFIHLLQSGKLNKDKKNKMTAENVYEEIEKFNVKIKTITKEHLDSYARLPLYDQHRDPYDRFIIAQAISDKITLVSSDSKFSHYRKYGLDFVKNER